MRKILLLILMVCFFGGVGGGGLELSGLFGLDTDKQEVRLSRFVDGKHLIGQLMGVTCSTRSPCSWPI